MSPSRPRRRFSSEAEGKAWSVLSQVIDLPVIRWPKKIREARQKAPKPIRLARIIRTGASQT